MDGLGGHYAKWSKSDRERQICHLYMESKKNDTNELICKRETDSQTYKQTYGYQRGKVGGGIN